MFTPYEAYIGLRYTRARQRRGFISFISLSSMLGIALGVTTLITVLSVMNGFEKELTGRILGMASHGTISSIDSELIGWQPLVQQSEEHPHVLGAAPYIRAEGMLTNSGQVRGAVIRGVLPEQEPKVSDVGNFMLSGQLADLKPGAFKVLLGVGLAQALGARIGTKVTIVAPQANISPAGILPRLKRFTVSGIFEVKHATYDSALAIVHMDDAAKLYRMKKEAVSGIRLKMDDMFRAREIVIELAKSFNGVYWITDWTQHHANFFRALQIEKTVMFVILSLIVAVAAFNIVSTLVMVVNDKQSDIAILRTLGATPNSIMRIFVIQGVLIGLIGTIFGVIGGVVLALNVENVVPAIEYLIGQQILDSSIYYISDVPSDLRWPDVIKIAIVSFALTVISTLYPARRAARTEPAEALRHE